MSDQKQQRKICIVVTSRASYARIKTVLRAVRDHSDLELQLVVSASAVLFRFGNIVDVMVKDGFEPVETIHTIIEGGSPVTMAKSTGLAIIELATVFENLAPDIVLTIADRFETMATAVSASYMNIPLAHTQGGEVTGSIDESVRHGVTKLAHLHFPATQKAAQNLIRMGEDPATVHVTGCPSIDIVNETDLSLPADVFERYKGVGSVIDATKPYLVVLQHPVTTEYPHGHEQIDETIRAVSKINMQALWLWPNVDAGSDDVAKGIRVFREDEHPTNIQFLRNVTAEDYACIINNCACLVGNSSSALREGSCMGVPAVNIGTRQSGREHGENVTHAGYDAADIEQAIRMQISNGRYPRSTLYGDGSAGEQIANILATAEVRIQKRLAY